MHACMLWAVELQLLGNWGWRIVALQFLPYKKTLCLLCTKSCAWFWYFWANLGIYSVKISLPKYSLNIFLKMSFAPEYFLNTLTSPVKSICVVRLLVKLGTLDPFVNFKNTPILHFLRSVRVFRKSFEASKVGNQ